MRSDKCSDVYSAIHARVVICTSTNIDMCVTQLVVRHMSDKAIHARTRTRTPGFRLRFSGHSELRTAHSASRPDTHLRPHPWGGGTCSLFGTQAGPSCAASPQTSAPSARHWLRSLDSPRFVQADRRKQREREGGGAQGVMRGDKGGQRETCMIAAGPLHTIMTRTGSVMCAVSGHWLRG